MSPSGGIFSLKRIYSLNRTRRGSGAAFACGHFQEGRQIGRVTDKQVQLLVLAQLLNHLKQPPRCNICFDEIAIYPANHRLASFVVLFKIRHN